MKPCGADILYIGSGEHSCLIHVFISPFNYTHPGIVNRTFENQIQSNSIYRLGSIEFGKRTKSNTELCVSSISEPIELNRTNRTQSNSIPKVVFDWVRTQSNTIKWIAFPKQSHQSKLFMCFFTILSVNNRNPIRNAWPFSPILLKTLKTSPSLTSKRHSW